MRFKLLLVLFISVIFSVSAQIKKCATVEYQKLLYQKYPEIKAAAERLEQQIREKTARLAAARIATTTDTTKLYVIPVVVHVIHSSPNGIIGENGNISDAQIMSQIEATNNDWRKLNADTTNTPSYFKPVGADMNFEFCLATRDPNGNVTNGITRTYSSTQEWDINGINSYKTLAYWPSDQYLNIWVANYTDSYLGLSQMPYGALAGLPYSADQGASTDGVSIDCNAFGTIGTVNDPGNPYYLPGFGNPYNLGRTLTHEIGHWLGGLRHPWGDTDCSSGHCCTDYVDDTPWQDGMDQDYNPCLFRTTNCNGPVDTIMYQNYMQYTGDNCMNLFTQGQKLRSRLAFWGCPRRMALLNSAGCCGQGINDSLPFTENFEQEDLQTKGWAFYGQDSLGWQYANYGGYGTSMKSITIGNSTTNSSQDAYLVTPFINFKSRNVPYLKFDYSYAANSSSATDTLVVSYNTNCRDTWIPMAKLYGQSLVTTSKIQDNFTPGADDWKTVYVDLPALNTYTGAKVRFENRSAGANNLYIDNINFNYTSPKPLVTVYPNPTDGLLNYKVLFEGDFTVKSELFDCVGRKLLEQDIASAFNNYIGTINLTGMASTMYLLKVTTNSTTNVFKIVVN